MQDLVGIVRTESEMQQALDDDRRNCARGRSARASRATASTTTAGTRPSISANMLIVSEAITRAALLRKESRGAQFREDFPEQRCRMGQAQHRRQARRGRRDAGGEARSHADAR